MKFIKIGMLESYLVLNNMLEFGVLMVSIDEWCFQEYA